MQTAHQVPVDLVLRVVQQLANPNMAVLFAETDGKTVRSVSCGDCGHSANNPNDIAHKSCCRSAGGNGCSSGDIGPPTQ